MPQTPEQARANKRKKARKRIAEIDQSLAAPGLMEKGGRQSLHDERRKLSNYLIESGRK